MPTKVIMPKLGESVVEGTVTKWLRKEGEQIGELEPLLEVNTDKVDTEIPSPAAGTVLKITVPEGTTVQAGTVLAWIGQPEEAVPGGGGNGKSASHAQAEPARQAAAQASDESLPVPSAGRSQELGFISPVVARLARENNVDLSQVKGTGTSGRITKRDVLDFMHQAAPEQGKQPVQAAQPAAEQQAWEIPADGDLFRPTEMVFGKQGGPAARPSAPLEQPAPATSPPSAPVHTETRVVTGPEVTSGDVLPLSNVRRMIAEHMVTSKRTSPHVTTVMEADLSKVVAHRQANLQSFERDGANLTYTAYFAAAAVKALKEFPLVNSSWTEQGIQLHRAVNLGIAVSLGDEGLIVPVIKGVDGLSLLGMARAINDLAARSRSHNLKPDEVKGGTFTITNHGISGSLFATPIINQPQCAILGVGAIQKRVVVIDDAIAIRPMVYLSLTFDHRILDGASGDHFLASVVKTLENWV